MRIFGAAVFTVAEKEVTKNTISSYLNLNVQLSFGRFFFCVQQTLISANIWHLHAYTPFQRWLIPTVAYVLEAKNEAARDTSRFFFFFLRMLLKMCGF